MTARLVVGFLLLVAASASNLLLISIDGLPYDALASLPKGSTLSAMVENSLVAPSTSTTPSVTYPAHTTLITAVPPNTHGIRNNYIFDPLYAHYGRYGEDWFWYGSDVKAPTIFALAKSAGLRTASIFWPATVGSKDVDVLVPEWWPMANVSRSAVGATAEMSALLRAVDGVFFLNDSTRCALAKMALPVADVVAVHFAGPPRPPPPTPPAPLDSPFFRLSGARR
jgi:predicted AlkP superfamily pyrophosphatase or phosphodiesterase